MVLVMMDAEAPRIKIWVKFSEEGTPTRITADNNNDTLVDDLIALTKARLQPQLDEFAITQLCLYEGRKALHVDDAVTSIRAGRSKDDALIIKAKVDTDVEGWGHKIPSMENPRFGPGIGVVGNKVYVIGGYNGIHNNLASMESYDTATKHWTTQPQLSIPRCFPGVGVLGHQIYVFGGRESSTPIACGEVFDTRTSTWSPLPEMTTKRQECGVAIVNDTTIIVCGGFDGDNFLRSAEKYDIPSRTWTRLPDMTSRRSRPGVVFLDGAVVVVGGHDGVTQLSSMEAYIVAENRWARLPSMRTKRYGPGVARVGRNIVAMGGFNGISCLETGEVYNTLSKKWRPMPEMGTKRSFPVLGAVKNFLIAVGGWDNNKTVLASAEGFLLKDDDMNEKMRTTLLCLQRLREKHTDLPGLYPDIWHMILYYSFEAVPKHRTQGTPSIV